MKKIIKLLYFIGLGLCASFHSVNAKKVAIVRFLYSGGNNVKDGIHMIEASENIKTLLKQTKIDENDDVDRIQVIDIYGSGILGNNLLIVNISNVKQRQIPTYTKEELQTFHRTQYDRRSAKMPVTWFFESKAWKEGKVWLFNKRKGKWYSMSFDEYNNGTWKQKIIRGIILLLLLLLMIGLYIIIRRRRKKL